MTDYQKLLGTPEITTHEKSEVYPDASDDIKAILAFPCGLEMLEFTDGSFSTLLDGTEFWSSDRRAVEQALWNWGVANDYIDASEAVTA